MHIRSVFLFLLVVILTAGCATRGSKSTEAAAVPDDVRVFSNGMQFVLKGEASDIIRGIERTHLERWGVKAKDRNSPATENNLVYPLYVQADRDRDHMITAVEAKAFKVLYQGEFDRSSPPVTFPAPQ